MPKSGRTWRPFVDEENEPMALPVLTAEQREEAQKKSLEARKKRSELLQRVKSGETTVAQVLEAGQDDPIPGKTKIMQVLKALQGVGEVRATEILDKADVPHDRRVKSLGKKQRLAVLEQLPA